VYLAADVGAIGRQHIRGGHDRLDNRAARRTVGDDRRSEEHARALPSAETRQDKRDERKPAMRHKPGAYRRGKGAFPRIGRASPPNCACNSNAIRANFYPRVGSSART